MSLKFSITKDPPTQAEIDKEKNRISKLRTALIPFVAILVGVLLLMMYQRAYDKDIIFGVAIVVVACLLSVNVLVSGDTITALFLAAVCSMVVTPLFGFAGFEIAVALVAFTFIAGVAVVAGFIDDNTSHRLHLLCVMEPPNLDAAIGYCDAYPEIAAYRDKVVRLDRKLTNGEFEAMQEYKQITDEQSVAAKYEEKLNKLHTEREGKRN